MGSPNSSLATAPRRHRALAHYCIVQDGEPGSLTPVTLHVADAVGRHIAHYETSRAALADLRKLWPGAKRVPIDWFAPVAMAKPVAPLEEPASDPLAPVRLSGTVWGQIDARNGAAGDAWLAYSKVWPKQPTGHYEAFVAAYLAAYTAERDSRRGPVSAAEGRAAVDAVLARTGGGGR